MTDPHPHDQRPPDLPPWAGHPGWVLYAVTPDPDEAARHAEAVAAAHPAQLTPGTWPADTPEQRGRIAVGPVYVATRTRHGHGHGAPLVTYYVVRRWAADAPAGGTPPTQAPLAAPDPAWPVPEGPSLGDAPGYTPEYAAGGEAGELPAAPPAWPFTAVGRRKSRAGGKTLGADVITWRGRLRGLTITFTTRPRAIDAHASFLVPSNARVQYATEHPQFVDVVVHHPLGAEARAELAALAQTQDTRPVVVRCVGEPVRGGPARARPARAQSHDAAQPTLFPAPPVPTAEADAHNAQPGSEGPGPHG